MDRTKEGAMLVAGQYVGGGRGKLPGRLVQGELPVRGVGRQEVEKVVRGGEGEEEETKCSPLHCCYVSESSAERCLRFTNLPSLSLVV